MPGRRRAQLQWILEPAASSAAPSRVSPRMHEGSSRHSSRISCSCARDSGVACRGHLAAQPKSPAVVHDRRVIASPDFRPRAVMTLRGRDIAPRPEPYSGLSRNVLPDEPSAAAAGRFPARAGSTSGPSSSSPKCRDHPRSRGEHSPTSGKVTSEVGSPPLARGAPRREAPSRHAVGITPARAGSTFVEIVFFMLLPDHPRSRGEHTFMRNSEIVKAGSPPLARGAHASGWSSRAHGWITPARAGSTQGGFACRESGWDHPRSRGEHTSECHHPSSTRGSPPLARGALAFVALHCPPGRITPARAGSTR